MRLVSFSPLLLAAPPRRPRPIAIDPTNGIGASPRIAARHGVLVLAVAAIVSAVGVGIVSPSESRAAGRTAAEDRPATPSDAAAEIDGLRRALAEAETAEAAVVARRRLELRRLRSGSVTADLLTARAGVARGAGDVSLALDLLDAAITVAPDWAGGRRLRGLVHLERGETGPALADLDAALRRDPTDATALFVSAGLRIGAGDAAGGLDLARRAQAADPYLPGLAEMVERLTMEVEGRPL